MSTRAFYTGIAAALLLLLPLSGCRTAPAGADAGGAQGFLNNLAAIKGRTYEGRVDEAFTPAGTFAGEQLIMRVDEVSRDGARIAFHVGEDQSRTWVLTRQRDGRLHLRHDHRDPDGTPHELTDYGGYAAPDSSAARQVFPADEATAEMLPEAATNVWTMELTADRFVYSLRRHGEPRFRAAFDLTQPR